MMISVDIHVIFLYVIIFLYIIVVRKVVCNIFICHNLFIYHNGKKSCIAEICKYQIKKLIE